MRIDSAIVVGWNVPPYYDSMVAKVIVHANDREAAIRRMRRALGELVVGGIKTNTRFLERVLDHEDFRAGRLSTRLVERMGPAPTPTLDAAAAPPT